MTTLPTLPNIPFIKTFLYGYEVIIMPSTCKRESVDNMYETTLQINKDLYLFEVAIYTNQLFGSSYPGYNIKPGEYGWFMIAPYAVAECLMDNDYNRRRAFWIEKEPHEI